MRLQLWQRKPQHFAGLEIRIITNNGTLLQGDCETFRLAAKYANIEGWHSLSGLIGTTPPDGWLDVQARVI